MLATIVDDLLIGGARYERRPLLQTPTDHWTPVSASRLAEMIVDTFNDLNTAVQAIRDGITLNTHYMEYRRVRS